MINKIIGFALAVVICSSAVAQSITVKGYGDKSITIDQDYHFDVNRKARGTYPETNIKQGYSFKDNHIEIVTYIHTLGQNEVGHSGKFYTQQIDKVLCYYPDFNARGVELITTITDNYLNNLGTNVKAIVRLTSKREDKKYFYCFSAENNNNIDGSGDIAEGAFLEMTIPNVEVAFTSLSKAEAFKKMLDDKIFDYALNLDAPDINYPFDEGNTFSADYPDGRLAKADEPTETEAENPILTDGSKLELNTGTYYKYREVVYNEKMEKLFINRGKDVGVYGGSSTIYAVEGDYLTGSKLLKDGKFLYFINTNIYYDAGKQNMFLSIFGSTIKKGSKQVGTAKNNFKSDSQGNNTFTAVDIAILVDLYEKALK